jgi:hypothetical protein
MNCVVEGLFQQDAFCPRSQLQHRIIVAFNGLGEPAATVPLKNDFLPLTLGRE